jgi:hypothetical protein
MSLTPGFSNEEIVAAVEEFLAVPHGMKRVWLARQPFSRDQLYRWRSGYLGGDIDRGLVPRHPVVVSKKAVNRVVELERELARERQAHAEQVDRLRREADKLREENSSLLAGGAALGKAIGLLRAASAQEPVTGGPTSTCSAATSPSASS